MTGKVIFDILSKTSAITAYVPSARITPQRRLQATDLPAITYGRVSTGPTNTKDGVSTLDTERWTINVFTVKYEDAIAISSLIRAALDRYTGTNNTVVVDSVVYEDYSELYEDWSEVHHHALDFKIRVKR